MALAQELLNVLACPHCKTAVTYDQKKNTLTCTRCKRVYAIKNDIPIMLP